MVGNDAICRRYVLGALKAVAVLAVLSSATVSLAAEIRETEFQKGTYVVAHRSFSIVSNPPANTVLIEVITPKEAPPTKVTEPQAVVLPKAEEARVAAAPAAPQAQVAEDAKKEEAGEFETKKVIVVRFQFDKYEIDPSEQEKIDRVVEVLKNAKTVKVTGFTDRVGTKEYNLALSKKRARQVKDYLVSHGVPKGSIEENGLGACCFASDDDKENRRAEVESLSRKSTTQKP